jgi:purine-cytosine permease-like protein
VVISQVKINMTNAYAGSLAWSNFFARLTHSHPGRVVWVVFNAVIAIILMELDVFKVLEEVLRLIFKHRYCMDYRGSSRFNHQQTTRIKP